MQHITYYISGANKKVNQIRESIWKPVVVALNIKENEQYFQFRSLYLADGVLLLFVSYVCII